MSKQKNKIRINGKESNRVLLSEILPTELPIIINNENFSFHYNNYNKNIYDNNVLGKIFKEFIIFNKIHETAPFSFKVPKGNLDTRTLSIPHPGLQIKLINFYEKYDSFIIYSCKKKNNLVSLRYPKKISTSSYMKEQKKIR
ncbi:hypothetical protein GKC56_00130 [Neisseriaceae bacterium PsAf]|nr:hypothetical protein [Neisseriaceae bacterium PsAf]